MAVYALSDANPRTAHTPVPPLVAQTNPPLQPPVRHVDGSVEPLPKLQPVRPHIRPLQVSSTLNDSDDPGAASQPVACDGLVPLEVNSAGQIVDAHEFVTVKVRAATSAGKRERRSSIASSDESSLGRCCAKTTITVGRSRSRECARGHALRTTRPLREVAEAAIEGKRRELELK